MLRKKITPGLINKRKGRIFDNRNDPWQKIPLRGVIKIRDTQLAYKHTLLQRCRVKIRERIEVAGGAWNKQEQRLLWLPRRRSRRLANRYRPAANQEVGGEIFSTVRIHKSVSV